MSLDPISAPTLANATAALYADADAIPLPHAFSLLDPSYFPSFMALPTLPLPLFPSIPINLLDLHIPLPTLPITLMNMASAPAVVAAGLPSLGALGARLRQLFMPPAVEAFFGKFITPLVSAFPFMHIILGLTCVASPPPPLPRAPPSASPPRSPPLPPPPRTQIRHTAARVCLLPFILLFHLASLALASLVAVFPPLNGLLNVWGRMLGVWLTLQVHLFGRGPCEGGFYTGLGEAGWKSYKHTSDVGTCSKEED